MNPYLRGRPRPVRVANVGHRGAMGLRPENTLESFELAFDLGAHMVELDVHPSKDGQVVVIHDDTLARTTNGGARLVSDLTLAELQALDAGRWFVDGLERSPLRPTEEERRRFLDAGALSALASGRVRAPSLAQVLELARRRERLVNVELKMVPRRYAALPRLVVDLVRRLKVEDRVLISSFDHAALAETKRLAPELPIAALCVARLHDAGRYVAEVLGGDAWNPGCVGEYDTLGFGSEAYARDGLAALDRAAVDAARARGVSVHTWTANDVPRLKALVELGVDGIITDFPNRLAALLPA